MIEVSNESGVDVSEEELISVARFVIKRRTLQAAGVFAHCVRSSHISSRFSTGRNPHGTALTHSSAGVVRDPEALVPVGRQGLVPRQTLSSLEHRA